MIERLCEGCQTPIKGVLFKGKCRKCYDRARTTTVISIPKGIEPLFKEFMGEREDISRGVIELMELGLRLWKQGKRVILMPL